MEVAFEQLDALEYFVLVVVIPLLLSTSVFLSIKMKWPQFRHFIDGVRLMLRPQHAEKKINSFAAVAAIIGGNLGTGTIAGTALAITTGGPGAILWMVVVALLCSVIKLCCSSLGVLFAEHQPNGRSIGGPMFYIARGLNSTKLATIYSVLLIGAALTVGNLVQVNAFVTTFQQNAHNTPIAICSLIIPVAFILFGGLRRFASFMSCIVPLVGIIYIAICMVGIINLHERCLPALREIVEGAIGWRSVIGGSSGILFFHALRCGVSRGLFATDIGLGLAGIAHANVDTIENNPSLHAKQQGIIAIVAPIFVAGLCAITGLLIICACPDMSLNSSAICIQTFNIAFHTHHAGIFIQIIIYTFALTTILAWAWFAEHAFFFAKKSHWVKYFKFVVIAAIPVGGYMHGTLPWTLADIIINGLLIANLIAIIALRHHVIEILKDES